MSRFTFSFVCAGALTLLMAGGAAAFGPAGDAGALAGPRQSLIIQVKPMTERQKCKALNRCRYHYTVCYNKLEAQYKLDQKDEVCVKPYQKCINATFSGMDFFFTRWFNPNYIDCKQYPG